MTAAAALRFSAGQASGFDELSGANPMFINARVFGDGSVRSRAGITTWADFPTDSPSLGSAVDSMAVFNDKVVFTTTDRRVFVWAAAGTVLDLSAAGGDTLLAGALRPSIAVSGSVCVLAGGGAPQVVNSAMMSTRLVGTPDMPPDAIDVAILTRRIVLVRRDSERFQWSGVLPLGENQWDGVIEFRDAEARADKLIAGRDLTREYWAFGATTTQVFDPDVTETFTPIVAVDVGCIARKSVITYEGKMAWLDDKRQIRLTNGRAIAEDSIISKAIAQTLQSLAVVDDCWGYRETIGSDDCLNFVFPTEGRTFVYSTAGKVWGESRGWSRGNWAPFKPTSFLHWPERNLFLVGLPDGTIGQLTMDAHTDMGDAINGSARTGFDDCGTPTPKDPVETQFVMRRGGASSAASKVRYRWRDELGPWCAPIDMTIGASGTFAPMVPVRPCGTTFYRRQHEISWSAAEAFTLAKSTMLYDELEA